MNRLHMEHRASLSGADREIDKRVTALFWRARTSVRTVTIERGTRCQQTQDSPSLADGMDAFIVADDRHEIVRPMS